MIHINGLSQRWAPLSIADVIEAGCIGAIVGIMNVWLHDWELPHALYIIVVHLIVIVVGRVLQPLSGWGMFLVFVLDLIALGMQSAIYMGRMDEYDLDKNTHDQVKEITKIGLLGGLAFISLTRFLGLGDNMIPGVGMESYSVRPQHQQQQQTWKQQQPLYGTPTMVYPQQMQQMQQAPTIAMTFPSQSMPYGYMPISSAPGPQGIPVAYSRS